MPGSTIPALAGAQSCLSSSGGAVRLTGSTAALWGCAGVAQLLKRPTPLETGNVRERGVRASGTVTTLGFPAAGVSSTTQRCQAMLLG